jgi:cyclohexyl-isocyanide hydratase
MTQPLNTGLLLFPTVTQPDMTGPAQVLSRVPCASRVMRDRNRMSGGGVTAWIDFGLTLAAERAGPEIAKLLQLSFEYDPAPPFDSGSPEKASPETLAMAQDIFKSRRGNMDDAIVQAAAKLSLP